MHALPVTLPVIIINNPLKEKSSISIVTFQGIREFRPPRESLEKTLENTKPRRSYDQQEATKSVKGGVKPGEPAAPAAVAAAAEVLSSPSTGIACHVEVCHVRGVTTYLLVYITVGTFGFFFM